MAVGHAIVRDHGTDHWVPCLTASLDRGCCCVRQEGGSGGSSTGGKGLGSHD